MPRSAKRPQDPSFFDHVLGTRPNTTRRSMFGCPCYFHEGRLAAVFDEGDFILRLPAADQATLRGRKWASDWKPTGTSIAREYVVISPDLLKESTELERWIQRSLAFAASRPLPKKRKPKKSV